MILWLNINTYLTPSARLGFIQVVTFLVGSPVLERLQLSPDIQFPETKFLNAGCVLRTDFPFMELFRIPNILDGINPHSEPT